ncbi:unnamed protein product, partial [Polarella glacialis]
ATLGRELLAPHLPIHGRGTWVVKAILQHPSVRKALRRWKVWLAAILAAAFAARRLRSRRLTPQPLPLQNSAPDTSPPPQLPLQTTTALRPRHRFAELLRPESGDGKGGGELIVGSREMATLVVTSILNAWLMLYKAWLMREFVTGQNMSDWRQWLKALAKFPVVTLASALLQQTTKYTQARVSLLWRQAATRRLMRGYFSGMNYYKLLHHGTLRIEDPDVRMCSDVRSACDALTGVFITGLSGFTMSLFSSYALYRRRGLWAVFLPYLYSFILVPMSFYLTSPDWTVVALVQKAWGGYQQALTRVGLMGEGVAMLRGEAFEKDVLDQHAADRASAERANWAAMGVFEWFQHFTSNPAMPGVWQTVASFGASFIAMRAYGPGRPVLDPRIPNEAIVYEYGANISDFWQVFYAVRGASTFMAAFENYKRCSQNVKRVEELQDAFAQLEIEADQAQTTSFLEGDCISFEDVSVVTPTGTRLLSGLNFKVEQGRNLMICGHNGAGKSSIFRCLGGLWPVATGRITCPRSTDGSGRGLHGAVYYLPQRPANILGSLSDQLTYPDRVPGGLPAEELRRWLSYADVDHLVDAAEKAGKLQEEADWATKLSLGEQQRLGIARVLYHRPRFAILDECTSAVSKEMERWLFQVARELGISCVTISHRPALLEYHQQMLSLTGKLAEDGRGWELVDLPTSDGLPDFEAKQPADTEAEVHRRVQSLLQSRTGRRRQAPAASNGSSLQTSALQATPSSSSSSTAPAAPHDVLKRWPSAARRIAAALQLHQASPASRVRFAALCACLMIRPQAAWEVYRTVGGSVGLAMCNDGAGLCAELLLNVTYAAGLCCLDRLIEALSRRLMLDTWSDLVSSLHRKALEAAAFHRVDLENPMQRIAEAKALLDDVKNQFSYTGGLLAQMIYFLPLLVRGGGPLPAATLVGLYAIHFGVRTHCMPNFKAITAKFSQFDDRFQVAQTRMRHVAEPVAFCGGGQAECQRVEEHFERLCEHRLCSMHEEFTYNFLTEFFLMYDNLPIWFHRLLSFNFAFRNVPIGGASPASAVQNYLYDRTISVSLVGVQALTAFPAELAKMDSRATRLLELQEALECVSQPHAGRRALATSSNDIVVSDLDLVTPSGTILARGMTFQVNRGDPLLVTGQNGAGKTGLARVLLGLWPTSGDRAVVSVPQDLSIVPQRPYLASGCLGDQVTYPKRFVPGDESRAQRALEEVGLTRLLDRAGDCRWMFRCNWDEVLSGGEQQRLALSRVLFHRPSFALLDECTSMVAADDEERLYRAVIQAGVTPLTFSQRLFLPLLHPQELRLTGDGGVLGWSLDRIGSQPP